MGSFAPIIASQLNIKVSQVQAVLDLFDEAATIPFIARYRKDKTGGLDEVQIQQIEEASKFLKTFTERKEFIEKAITEQGKMTDELQKKLDAATTLAALEDIYLPYKPKHKKEIGPLSPRYIGEEVRTIIYTSEQILKSMKIGILLIS